MAHDRRELTLGAVLARLEEREQDIAAQAGEARARAAQPRSALVGVVGEGPCVQGLAAGAQSAVRAGPVTKPRCP
ncbi:hypothetical protein [Streptomyces rapamycinicus]|uniref:Uncharacterized protein n=1 Tax=Streptomyces rapamycinicus TaxID=1226757 RepID=A0ABR6LCD8_9ACTN|nr:hypothetical protein M271_00785 [Streptomyces rapamycinicus NRRL 5491]MBB4779208.1 hypothetical protein [Streptomyces rapamycinicus]